LKIKGQTYSKNALRPDQLDLLVLNGAGGVALAISLEVAQVANVTVLVGRGAVLLGKGVD
jgi:hypothetical protein